MRPFLLEKLRLSPALVVAITALAVALGGVAYATIPDAGGTIHGCYGPLGVLRVIDTDTGQHCTAYEKPLNWSQTGPQGPAGATGPAGPPGTAAAVETNTVENAVLPFPPPPSTWTNVVSLNLAKGHYLVNGAVLVDNAAYDNVTECGLIASNNNPFSSNTQATIFDGELADGQQVPGEATLNVTGLINLSAATTISVECLADPYSNYPPSGDVAGNVLTVYMNAVTISSVNGS